MFRTQPFLQPMQEGDVIAKILTGQTVLAADVILELLHIAELPLARRVIHQANDADFVVGAKLGQFFHQRFRTDLGPQVDMVADRQRPAVAHRQDFIGHVAGVFPVALASFVRQDRPHPDRVENRGDPGARQLAVMGDDRRAVGPVDLGARLHVALKVVGVQLDQPGGEVAALAIDRSFGQGGAFRDIGDHPVTQHHAAGDHRIGQDDFGIGENGFFCHVNVTLVAHPWMQGEDE